MARQSEWEAVDALIQRADQLHSPPEVARSLLNLTRDEDFDVQSVVECIERDPALTAKLLEVVNSSRYGLRSKIANLRQAVAYLGQRTVRLVAMAFNIVDSFSRGPARELYNDYWRRALTIASAAHRISDRDESLDRHDAYTAGLLADLGSLVLAQVVGEPYLQLYRESPNRSLAEAEREVFNFDHSMVGARLLRQWDLPLELVEAIRQHHDDTVQSPLSVATRAGVLVSDALWEQDSSVVQVCRLWLEEHYDIDLDGFTDLAIECKEEVTLEAELYGVNMCPAVDCQAIIEEARRQYLKSSISTAMDLDSVAGFLDDV